ncbi:MAG: hypothetical protein KatS3mg077_2125 [Candidatus Binatia bacterium]|nr:MAG: hypothetical protein KatS3mg077_2125 [Candidatus Binatia bacterium]
MHAQVQRSDGTIAFAKVVAGEGKVRNVLLSSGTNAKTALDLALKDAVDKLFSDRTFLDALMVAGKG